MSEARTKIQTAIRLLDEAILEITSELPQNAPTGVTSVSAPSNVPTPQIEPAKATPAVSAHVALLIAAAIAAASKLTGPRVDELAVKVAAIQQAKTAEETHAAAWDAYRFANLLGEDFKVDVSALTPLLNDIRSKTGEDTNVIVGDLGEVEKGDLTR